MTHREKHVTTHQIYYHLIKDGVTRIKTFRSIFQAQAWASIHHVENVSALGHELEKDGKAVRGDIIFKIEEYL